MKVSVAMATFNGGRHLKEQLDSIRSQTLLPMELVICDDGSTDDTLEVARRFADDAPFNVIIDAHGRRLGFTGNFVRAIGHCTGEIVALCDQDDVWSERKLATVTAEFRDEGVTIVAHRVRVVDEHLNPTPVVEPALPFCGRHTLHDIDPWFSPNGMQMLLRRASIVPWLQRNPPLSAYGFGTAPFDEWIFWLGTLKGTIVVLEEVLGVWRRHRSAATRDLQSIAEENTAAHHLRLALHSAGAAYAFRAEITDSRAEFCERLLSSPDGVETEGVAGAAEFYREMSCMFRRRIWLHDPARGFLERLLAFRSLAAHRDYRSRSRGGLGAKAVLKDVFTIFFGPRPSTD